MLNEDQKTRVRLALEADPKKFRPAARLFIPNFSENSPIQLVPNKKEQYAHYEARTFGNKPLTWSTYNEIIEKNWKGKVCMRGRKSIDRKLVRYDLSIEEIPNVLKEWKKYGISAQEVSYNQSMPNSHLKIQGETIRTINHLDVIYSTVQKPMIEALSKERIYVKGLSAINLLKANFSESSFEDLTALMDMFPESSVEFSTYDIFVGNIPGRNTIIWEVRNY